MKRIEAAQLASIIANIGVIAGILLLVFELRQNNELMAAEARLNRTNMAVEAWRMTAESSDLGELREREKLGEQLTPGETRRVDSAVMSIFVVLEWTFNELGEGSSQMAQVREVQRYNWTNAPEYPRVWEKRKQSFDPAFISWMERNVVQQ